MNLHKFREIHPDLLLGLVNTALRNDCEDLEDLVRTHDIDKAELEARLAEQGYRYVAAVRQFRKGEPD